MPHKDTHDLRLRNPDSFKAIRRQNDRFGEGIDVTWGIDKGKGGKAVIQSLHFDKAKFSLADAKVWARDHDYKPIEVHPAIKDESTMPTTTASNISPFASKAKIYSRFDDQPILHKLDNWFKDRDGISNKEYVLKVVR
jgi:hypothetical protein